MILKNKYPIFWFFVTFFYCLDISIVLTFLSVILLFSTILNISNKNFYLENFPYAILLSPCLYFIEFGSINLLYSDFLLIFGGFLIILKKIIYNQGILKFNRKSSMIVKIFMSIFIWNLFQMSIYNVVGAYVDFKFYFYILTHLIVFFSFLSFDINYKDQKLLLKSFLISVFFASIISIFYYIEGISLLGWTGEEFAEASELNEFSFFKATYFYTGFFLYLGCSIALLAYLLTKKDITFKMKSLVLIALVIEILVSFPLINKTLYISLIGTFLLVQIYLYKHSFFLFIKSIFTKMLIILFIILSVILTIDFSVYERFFEYSTQTESLYVRLYIFGNSINILASNFFSLVFGEGIGFLLSNEPKSLLYKKNAYGLIEGTVDSQYMNILIETGLVGFVLVLIFIFTVIYRFLGIKKNKNWFTVPILITFAFIAISCLTQRMGLAKLSLILPVVTVLLVKFNSQKKYQL